MTNLLNATKEVLKLERFKKWYRFHIEVNDGRNEVFTVKKHFNTLTKKGAMKRYDKMFTSNEYTILKVEIVD